jgi:hypothetical protein
MAVKQIVPAVSTHAGKMTGPLDLIRGKTDSFSGKMKPAIRSIIPQNAADTVLRHSTGIAGPAGFYSSPGIADAFGKRQRGAVPLSRQRLGTF